MKYSNKVAVVTGGGSGIGRAISIALGAAGAKVFIGDLNAESGDGVVEEIRKAGGEATYVKVDVADEDSVQAFADTVHSKVDKVDIVINGAGWDKVEPFMNNTVELRKKIVAINLMGPISITRAFLEPMIKAKSGKIVSISSDAGRVGSSGETVYAGAKGGVISFTKSLAREMARYGINVNCVCPGPTDTPLFRASIPENMVEAFVKTIPFRRLATSEDIVAAVLYFTDSGSDYVTGQVLSVSGGLTMAD